MSFYGPCFSATAAPEGQLQFRSLCVLVLLSFLPIQATNFGVIVIMRSEGLLILSAKCLNIYFILIVTFLGITTETLKAKSRLH